MQHFAHLFVSLYQAFMLLRRNILAAECEIQPHFGFVAGADGVKQVPFEDIFVVPLCPPSTIFTATDLEALRSWSVSEYSSSLGNFFVSQNTSIASA